MNKKVSSQSGDLESRDWDDDFIDQIIEEVESDSLTELDDGYPGLEDVSLGTMQEIWPNRKRRARQAS